MSAPKSHNSTSGNTGRSRVGRVRHSISTFLTAIAVPAIIMGIAALLSRTWDGASHAALVWGAVAALISAMANATAPEVGRCFDEERSKQIRSTAYVVGAVCRALSMLLVGWGFIAGI